MAALGRDAATPGFLTPMRVGANLALRPESLMKPKILVVEDEPDVVELLEFNLRGAGFDVVSAEDGAEALKKAREQTPALVILDLMLPAVDGLEVCKILRRHPATAAIP